MVQSLLYENIPTEDPNSAMTKGWNLKAWRDSFALNSKDVSLDDFVEAQLQTISETLNLCVSVRIDIPLSQKLAQLDSLSMQATAFVMRALKKQLKRWGQGPTKAAADEFKKIIMHLNAAAKQKVLESELSKPGQTTNKLPGKSRGPNPLRSDLADRPMFSSSSESTNAVVSGPTSQSAMSLSDRDQMVHDIVTGEHFRTLRNSEIMQSRPIALRLQKECKFQSRSNALKCSLDRIRKKKGYPLSREVENKRSGKKPTNGQGEGSPHIKGPINQ